MEEGLESKLRYFYAGYNDKVQFQRHMQFNSFGDE
jgi:hypothetical protein